MGNEQDIQRQKDQYEGEIGRLSQVNKDLISNLKSTNEQKIKLQKDLNQEKENLIISNNQNIKKIEDDYENKISQTKQLSQQEKQQIEIERQQQLELLKQNFQQQLQLKEQENNEKTENISLKIKELEQKKNQEFLHSKNEKYTQYHQQILFKSLLELKDGIIMHNNKEEQQTNEQFQQWIEKDSKFVGILGRFNSGKTWLLSKITRKNFKSGLDMRTEGINMYYMNQLDENQQNYDQVVFLDTAGSGEPLQFYEKNKYVEEEEEKQLQGQEQISLKEKKQNIEKKKEESFKNLLNSEKFIQSFIIKESQITIMVIGIMNIDDERQVNMLMKQLMEQNLDTNNKQKIERQLFIVHNYFNLPSIEAVQEKIKKNVFNCFGEVKAGSHKKDMQPFYYQQFYDDTNTNPVYHMIMAKEGTPAGDVYNEQSICFIRESIDRYRAKHNSKNVMKCLETFLKERIGDYLRIGKQGQQLELGLQNELKDNKTLIKSNLMNQEKDIEFTQIYFDHFGQIMSFDEIKQQPYFIVKEQTQFLIFLQVTEVLSIDQLSEDSDVIEKDKKLYLIVKIMKNNDQFISKLIHFAKDNQLIKEQNFTKDQLVNTFKDNQNLFQQSIYLEDYDSTFNYTISSEPVLYNSIIIIKVEKNKQKKGWKNK